MKSLKFTKPPSPEGDKVTLSPSRLDFHLYNILSKKSTSNIYLAKRKRNLEYEPNNITIKLVTNSEYI